MKTVERKIRQINQAAIYLAGLFVFAACATTPKVETPAATPPPIVSSPSVGDQEERIDLEGLSRSLNLSRPDEVLGYQEAAFNSCSAGFGFSASKKCRRLTMAVIHFRLQCRDSEGTISAALGTSDLQPIAGQGVQWTVSDKEAVVTGVATTDGQGYGEVLGIFVRSPKTKWLRLAVGVQFLNIRAGDITRVVTPRPWCHAD